MSALPLCCLAEILSASANVILILQHPKITKKSSSGGGGACGHEALDVCQVFLLPPGQGRRGDATSGEAPPTRCRL